MHDPRRDRRPGRQRPHRPRAGARLPRGGGGDRAVPRAGAERLRDRRPAAAGHAARRRRAGRRRPRRGLGRPAAGPGRRCPARARHPRRQRGRGHPPRGVARRVGEVLPADLPRVLRASVVRPRRRPSRRDDPGGGSRRASRPRPDLRRDRRARAAAARRDLRGHVGPDPAQRRGRARGRHRADQPVRQPDHGRPRRGPTPPRPQRERAVQRGVPLRRRGPGGVDHRPLVGRPDAGVRVRRPPRGERAVPGDRAAQRRRRRPGPDPAGADPAGHLRRQPPDLRHLERLDHRGKAVPDHPVRAATAERRHRAAAQGRPVPVRARRRGASRAGLLRGLQHPGVRPRATAARDRPAQDHDRGERWARLHPRAHRRRQGDGPARSPAQRHPRLHDAGLRDRRDHEVLRDPAVEVARA